MLNVLPKISEIDMVNLEDMRDYMSVAKGVEVQLLSDNLKVGFRRSCEIVEQFKNIEYVVLHIPFSMVNLCYIHSNKKVESQFVELVVECVKYSLKTGLKIDILTHVGVRLFEFIGIGGIEFLNHLAQMVEDTDVGFLLENSIISLNKEESEDDIITGIFKIYDHKKVNFCLDLCHWQSSEYATKREIELDVALLRKLKNIHFSMTYNKEGYINKKTTHGRGHTSLEACMADLEYLKNKGVDLNTVNIVTEISEKDYKTRPDMNRELGYLREIELM